MLCLSFKCRCNIFHIQMAYYGAARAAPLEYFAKMGHVCDPLFNPADFLSKLCILNRMELIDP